MAHFNPKTIWFKKNAVSLTESRMTEDVLSVEIKLEDKNGKRMFPDVLYIKKTKAMLCPIKYIKGQKKRTIQLSAFTTNKELA